MPSQRIFWPWARMIKCSTNTLHGPEAGLEVCETVSTTSPPTSTCTNVNTATNSDSDFILVPDHILDHLGELPGDLITYPSTIWVC